MNVGFRILHPLFDGMSITWTRETGAEVFYAALVDQEGSEFRLSPVLRHALATACANGGSGSTAIRRGRFPAARRPPRQGLHRLSRADRRLRRRRAPPAIARRARHLMVDARARKASATPTSPPCAACSPRSRSSSASPSRTRSPRPRSTHFTGLLSAGASLPARSSAATASGFPRRSGTAISATRPALPISSRSMPFSTCSTPISIAPPAP